MAGAKDMFLAWLPTNDREQMLDGRVHEGEGKEGPITPAGWQGNHTSLFLPQNGFMVWNAEPKTCRTVGTSDHKTGFLMIYQP